MVFSAVYNWEKEQTQSTVHNSCASLQQQHMLSLSKILSTHAVFSLYLFPSIYIWAFLPRPWCWCVVVVFVGMAIVGQVQNTLTFSQPLELQLPHPAALSQAHIHIQVDIQVQVHSFVLCGTLAVVVVPLRCCRCCCCYCCSCRRWPHATFWVRCCRAVGNGHKWAI